MSGDPSRGWLLCGLAALAVWGMILGEWAGAIALCGVVWVGSWDESC